MTNVKINLVISLPGSVMMSEQECSKQLKKPVINKRGRYAGKQAKDKQGNLLWEYETVPDKSKYDTNHIKVNGETITYLTRQYKNAVQSINICDEAYDYFISKEVPAQFRAEKIDKKTLFGAALNIYVWEHMSKEARLAWHLTNIAESLGGTVFSYTIFND